MSDAVAATLWLAVNGLLGLTSWKTARALYPRDGVYQNIVHALVLGWACVVSVSTALGLAGVLAGFPLLAGVACVCLVALAVLSRRPVPAPRPRRLRPGDVCWAVVWGMVLSAWAGHVVHNGLLRFPTDWDSLNYHIPLVVQWLHAGSLYAPDCFHWSNPGNGELLGLWMVAPFSGDFLIHLNTLPAALLLALGSVELGRSLGLSRTFAHLAALTVVSHYVVLRQLVSNENDVAAAALFVAATAYELRHLRRGRRADLVLCAVSLGLLAGVKFYALGYALLLAAVLCGALALRRGAAAAGGAFAVLLAGLVLWGGYWYLRNVVVTGSPVFPKGLREEDDVLRLIYPEVDRSSFLGSGRPEVFPLFGVAVWRMIGPCHLAALLALPLSAAWLVAPWRRWRRGGARTARLVVSLLLLGALALVLVTPFAVEDAPGTLNQLRAHYCPVRYALCLLTLAVFGLCLVLQDGCRALRRLPRGARWPAWIPPGLLAAGALFQFVRPSPRLGWPTVDLGWPKVDNGLFSADIFLAACVGVVVWHLWSSLRRALVPAAAVAALLGWAVACDRLSEHWHRGFARHYEGFFFTWAFRHLADDDPDGARVCVLDYRSYPFFGSARQFRVCQPLYVPSPDGLLDYLRSRRATLVAAAPGERHQGWNYFLWFDECRAHHPDSFRPLDSEGRFSLFRFIAPSPRPPRSP